MAKTYNVDVVVDARRDKTKKKSYTSGSSSEEEETTKQKRPYGKERKEAGSDSSSSSEVDEECCQLSSLDPWRYPLYSPSASYRQVDVVSGSHQYTISGFTLARSMGCGTRLCSDFFEICGQLFRLEVYPGGFTADTRRYVSVFLTTPGALNPNHILYEIAILDQSGKDKHIIEKRNAHDRQGFGGGMCPMQGPMIACSRGIIAAVPKFIKTKFLEKQCKRYMPCDMLVLRATVQILQGWSSTPMVHNHLAYNAGCGSMPALPGQLLVQNPLHGMSAMYAQPQLPASHQVSSFGPASYHSPPTSTSMATLHSGGMPMYHQSSQQLQPVPLMPRPQVAASVPMPGSYAGGMPSASMQSPVKPAIYQTPMQPSQAYLSPQQHQQQQPQYTLSQSPMYQQQQQFQQAIPGAQAGMPYSGMAGPSMMGSLGLVGSPGMSPMRPASVPPQYLVYMNSPHM